MENNNNSKAAHADDSIETVRALKTAAAQIDISLHESEGAVGSLVESITETGRCVQSVQGELASMLAAVGSNDAINRISEQCDQAETSLQKAIVALQFYDRLTQRFLHIQQNLRAAADLVLTPDQQHHDLWNSLHSKMRTVYSLEQEQQIHHSLLMETIAKELVGQSVEKRRTGSDGIDLF